MSTTNANNRLRRQGSSRMAYQLPSEFVASFTPKEVETLTTTFARFDAESGSVDQTIDCAQVKPMLDHLGENASQAQIDDLLRESDIPVNGKVTFADFLQVVLRLRMGVVSDNAKTFLGQPKPATSSVTSAAPTSAARRPSALHSSTVNTIKTETGATHSYSDAEKVAFSEHINRILATDERLTDRLPLDPHTQALFQAVGDGLLLCKLINKAQPDTVDERVLNLQPKLNVYQINENLNVAINAAKAIGCKVVNVHNEDIIDGREHIILGLVWQIVRIQLLSQINLKSHPELVRLLEAGEELADLLKLPPDQILLRWLNFHLKQAGDSRRVRNFGDDLKDSHVYTVVLNQIQPKTCDLSALTLDDPIERATRVIANAATLGVESIIKPQNIVDANQKLNLAFCAQIFNANPGLVVTEEELHEMAGLLDDDVGDSREERVFRMWMNTLGEDIHVENLYEDLRDGIVILQVMDRVEPGIVSWKGVNRTGNLNKFKKVENCNYAVVLGKANVFKFSLVGIGGVDLVDARKKAVLSITWQLMRHHALKIISSLSRDGKPVTDRDILEWANERVARTGKESRMASFRDQSLSTSVFFLHLCAALAPGIVDPAIATDGTTDEEKVSNAKYVISIARKLGASVFLSWEDLIEVKPKMILTFLAALRAWDEAAPGKAL